MGNTLLAGYFLWCYNCIRGLFRGEKEKKGVAMRIKCLILFMIIVSVWCAAWANCQAQSTGNCVVVEKYGSTEMIVSCPDGSRTVDVGGRIDLYRVGDRIDIYGMPGNQPASVPGQTPVYGR